MTNHKTKRYKDKYILGSLADSIINTIVHTERILDRQMMFNFDVPLRDGRLLSIKLDVNNTPTNPIAEELMKAESNTRDEHESTNSH